MGKNHGSGKAVAHDDREYRYYDPVCFDLGAFTTFTFVGARFGDVTLAANQILQQFVYVTAYALDGFAAAAETLVGQAMGAKARAQLRRSAIRISQWVFGISFAFSAFFWFMGPTVIDWMTTAPEVQIEAREYLIWMVLTPVLGWPSWILDGIFIGATRTRDMRNMMLVSAIVYAGMLWFFLPLLGPHGLWLSITAFYVIRAMTLAVRYPALERSAVYPL